MRKRLACFSGVVSAVIAAVFLTGCDRENGGAGADDKPDEVVPASNTVTVDDVTDIVRAVFHDAAYEDGATMIYVTSADISYLSEIDNAKDFIAILVDDGFLDGTEIDIAEGGCRYGIYYVNNQFGNGVGTAWDEPAEMVGGTVSVRESSPGIFSVRLNAVISGVFLSVDYEGAVISSEIAPEPEPVLNCFKYNGGQTIISSAVVDMSGNISALDGEACWEVWLSGDEGKTDVSDMDAGRDVHVVAPKSCFDGNVYGFSMCREPSLYAEFDGVRWVYDTGAGAQDNATGTFEASVDGDSMTLHFYNLKTGDPDNPDTMEIYYSGPVNVTGND